MALDLQEQEELEEVKRIWHGWLKWVVFLLLAVALVYLAQTAWHDYQRSRNEQAADLLLQFQNFMEQSQQAKALEVLKTLQQKYPKTMPTAIATSAVGAISFYNNKLEEASRHFQWVYDHQQNEFVKVMSIVDLARIKMQQKKFDEALALLDKKTEPALQFLLEDLKGDIYMVKGNEEASQKAYDKAVSLLPKPNEVVTEEDIDQIRAQIEAKKVIQLPKI